MTPVARALGAPLAALALAACGGGDDRPQTKTAYIAAADEVCLQAREDLARAGAREPQNPSQVAAANEVLADQYERLRERIERIPLPAAGADRAGARRFVASLRRADPLLERLRAASERLVQARGGEDPDALASAGNDVRAALDAFRAARAESDLLAISYGFNVCGNIG